MGNKYSVFISYKRNGGSCWAEVVRMGLLLYGETINGKFCDDDIKMDVHSNSQDWRKEIVTNIKNCVNVIVVIHKGFENSLHKDGEDDIWLEEIDIAYRYKRAIIPFFVDGLVVNEKLDAIFDADKRLTLLKQICHNNQQLCYTHGKCEGSIIALRKAFKNEQYVLRKIRFMSVPKCHLTTPDGLRAISEEQDYILSVNCSHDAPIEIIAKHDLSGRKLIYHICFDEFADDNFRFCAQNLTQSTTDIYLLINNKTPINEYEMAKDVFIEWQELSATVISPSFNHTSIALSSLLSSNIINANTKI